MKTYKSTLNRYFVSCAFVLALTVAAVAIPALSPFRSAISTSLGLTESQFWILFAPLSFCALLILSLRVRTNLSEPIESFAEQCSLGNLSTDPSQILPRELRIVRNYLHQSHERANDRAHQISQMEEELHKTRKASERSIRKIEELEDIISSYSRIRKELSYDISLLRQENKNQNAKIQSLKTEHAQRFPQIRDTTISYGNS